MRLSIGDIDLKLMQERRPLCHLIFFVTTTTANFFSMPAIQTIRLEVVRPYMRSAHTYSTVGPISISVFFIFSTKTHSKRNFDSQRSKVMVMSYSTVLTPQCIIKGSDNRPFGFKESPSFPQFFKLCHCLPFPQPGEGHC